MPPEQNCPFDVTPLDQSALTEVPKFNNLVYTNQDFFSMKSRLVQFIREQFPNDFNDFVESSLAIMLIENFAFIADLLSFKIDQIANEVYIDTVAEVENAFRLAQIVGFQPTPPIAATALFAASLLQNLTVDVTIPAGISVDLVAEGRTITFELFLADSNNEPMFEEDIIIPAGNVANTSIVGVEGQTFTDSFSGTGEANQTYTLANSSVIFDSIRVDIDGVRWTQVDFFTDSQPRREYRVQFDSSYTAFIIFGNNKGGIIPGNGSVIAVTYRSGGGTVGNIVTGAASFQRNISVPNLQFFVPVNFTNYTKAMHGYNGDGVEEIRNKLPLFIKTQNRAVTGEDYKILADQFITPYNGQIGKATAVLRNHGCAGNVIDIFVLALDANQMLMEASSILKTMLFDELQIKKMITDFICIRDGVVLEVDVHIDVTLDKTFRKLKEEIDTKINRRINKFFSLSNWDYGQVLRDSDLLKVLSDVKEVNTYDISFLTNDPNNQGQTVTTKYFEIIRPDQVILNYVFV
jgi:hypothetical protein